MVLEAMMLLVLFNADVEPPGAAARPRQAGIPIGKGTAPAIITITSPAGGWTVDRMMLVEGQISDATVNPVVLSINGDRYLLRTFSGRFSRKFPAATGKNVINVQATNQAGTARAQVTTYAQIPPVPLKAVLTSDTDGVYTDLHIYEPTQGSILPNGTIDPTQMAHVYWAQTESPSGGTFFLNAQGGDFDQPGYGPYLYIHRAPPKGVFAIATNYWPSGDQAHTVAFLNLTLFEGTPNEIRRVARVPLATLGTTRVLAFVNVLGEGRALLYVPGQDPLPAAAPWPAGLETLTEKIVAGAVGGGGE